MSRTTGAWQARPNLAQLPAALLEGPGPGPAALGAGAAHRLGRGPGGGGGLDTGSASARLVHGIARQGIVQHRELDIAQALDLVAQPRRFLEFEIGGGLAHALLHVGDDALEIVADERSAVFGE